VPCLSCEVYRQSLPTTSASWATTLEYIGAICAIAFAAELALDDVDNLIIAWQVGFPQDFLIVALDEARPGRFGSHALDRLWLLDRRP